MKKFFRNAAILVFGFGMASALTACHSGSNEVEAEVVPVPANINTVSRTLIVSANVPARIVFDGQTKNGQEVTFTEVAQAGTLNVSAAGYEPQTVAVAFGDETALQVNVQLYKASTNQVPQNEGTALTVTNDSENQNDNVIEDENGNATTVTATIEVPEDVNTTGNTTDPFSIVVFTPASGTAADVVENQPVAEPVLAIACTPDGAYFEKPVKVTVNIPGSEGLDISLKNGGETLALVQNGDELTAEVPHFSVWDYVLNGRVQNVETVSEVIYAEDRAVSAGRQTVRYGRKLGYEADYTAQSLIGKFLSTLFGVKVREVNTSFTFTAPQAGTANIKIEQAVKTVTFQSGSKTFQVKVYGAVTPTVNIIPAEPTAQPTVPTHSGGGSL